MNTKYIYTLIFCIALASSCSNPTKEVPKTIELPVDTPNAAISKPKEIPLPADTSEKASAVNILELQDGTYGYIIEHNGMKIKQTSIPGKAGKSGFKTRAQALSVANLVLAKMKKSSDFPSVTEQDLRNLGIK